LKKEWENLETSTKVRTVDQLPLRVRRKLAKEVKKVIASSGSIKESALAGTLVHFFIQNPREAQVKAKSVAELLPEKKVAAKGRANHLPGTSRLRGRLRRIAVNLPTNLSILSSEERRLLGNLGPEFADSFYMENATKAKIATTITRGLANTSSRESAKRETIASTCTSRVRRSRRMWRLLRRTRRVSKSLVEKTLLRRVRGGAGIRRLHQSRLQSPMPNREPCDFEVMLLQAERPSVWETRQKSQMNRAMKKIRQLHHQQIRCWVVAHVVKSNR